MNFSFFTIGLFITGGIVLIWITGQALLLIAIGKYRRDEGFWRRIPQAVAGCFLAGLALVGGIRMAQYVAVHTMAANYRARPGFTATEKHSLNESHVSYNGPSENGSMGAGLPMVVGVGLIVLTTLGLAGYPVFFLSLRARKQRNIAGFPVISPAAPSGV